MASNSQVYRSKDNSIIIDITCPPEVTSFLGNTSWFHNSNLIMNNAAKDGTIPINGIDTVNKKSRDTNSHTCNGNVEQLRISSSTTMDNDTSKGCHVTLTVRDSSNIHAGRYELVIKDKEENVVAKRYADVRLADHYKITYRESDLFAGCGHMTGYQWHFTDHVSKTSNNPIVGLDIFVCDWVDCHAKIIEGIWLRYSDGSCVIHGGCVVNDASSPSERHRLRFHDNERITKIKIGHGWVIDNLMVTTTSQTFGPYGGSGGDVISDIELGPSEYLAGFKGSVMLSRGKTCLTNLVVSVGKLE